MKRNCNRLNLVKPQQFRLESTNCCKYAVFYDMYGSIEIELIKTKVVMMLEEPEFQDKDGNCVEFESKEYGCKVNHRITLPDMVLLGDGVGANIDTTGDGHIGGDKFICEKGCIEQRKTTIKLKHFIVIGLTNLLGEPIFCILIIEGK